LSSSTGEKKGSATFVQKKKLKKIGEKNWKKIGSDSN
jgi:hypothetical protein